MPRRCDIGSHPASVRRCVHPTQFWPRTQTTYPRLETAGTSLGQLCPVRVGHPTIVRRPGHPAELSANCHHSDPTYRNIPCDDSPPSTPTVDHDCQPRDRRHGVGPHGFEEFWKGPSCIARHTTSCRRLVGHSQSWTTERLSHLAGALGNSTVSDCVGQTRG